MLKKLKKGHLLRGVSSSDNVPSERGNAAISLDFSRAVKSCETITRTKTVTKISKGAIAHNCIPSIDFKRCLYIKFYLFDLILKIFVCYFYEVWCL